MRLTLLSASCVAILTTAAAAEFRPAVVYDLGGRADGSFNEAAFVGAERFAAETGAAYRDFEIQNDAQREQALRRFARDGFDPVVAIGFSHANALERVAADFPDTRFAIVDMVVDQPNVRSILFKEHEGSYLVGILAAMAAGEADVGFVGGMDIPLIRKFACGYVGGAKSVRPDITVFQNMTGTTGAAWNDPARGAELATSQINQGAEVVYHAAGGTGVGVLQAAADAGVLGVGTDSNQNGLHPGQVLTSLLKRTDVAVEEAFTAWAPGVRSLGLAEGGMDWARDEHNAALITPEMAAAADAAFAAIAAGEIVVHDSSVDGPCPVN